MKSNGICCGKFQCALKRHLLRVHVKPNGKLNIDSIKFIEKFNYKFCSDCQDIDYKNHFCKKKSKITQTVTEKKFDELGPSFREK